MTPSLNNIVTVTLTSDLLIPNTPITIIHNSILVNLAHVALVPTAQRVAKKLMEYTMELSSQNFLRVAHS